MSDIPGNASHPSSSGDENTINVPERRVSHLALLRELEIKLEDRLGICRITAIAFAYNMLSRRISRAGTRNCEPLASSLDILIFDDLWIGFALQGGLCSALRHLVQRYNRNNRIFGTSQRTPVREGYGPFGRVRVMRVSHGITEYIDGHEYVDYIQNWLYELISIRMSDGPFIFNLGRLPERWVEAPGGRVLRFFLDDDEEEDI